MIKKLLQKYQSMSLTLRAAIWYVCCNVLQRGISVITTPIFTRLLTVEQYGIYTLYNSWFNILIHFTSLSLFFASFNNAMIKFEQNRSEYISAMQGLTTVLTLAFFLLYWFFRQFWNQLFGLPTLLMVLMFVQLLVFPAFQFWSGRQRFEYHYRGLVLLTLAQCILNPVVGVIAVMATEYKVEARIASMVAVEVLFAGGLMLYQFVRGRCFFNRGYWKFGLWFNVPLLPHYLSGYVLGQGDRIMIEKMVGTREVGIYGLAYQIGALMSMVTSALNAGFTPWLYERYRNREWGEVRKTATVLCVLLLIPLLLVVLLAPELVWFFGAGASEYQEAAYVIPPISASVFFIFLYQLFNTVEFYYAQRSYITLSSVLAAVLNILLNLVFITLFGYIAAGYTTLVCYILYSLFHYLCVKRICHKREEGELPFDGKRLFLSGILLSALSIGCTFLYPYAWVRYGLIVLLCVLAILLRRRILGVLRTLIAVKSSKPFVEQESSSGEKYE